MNQVIKQLFLGLCLLLVPSSLFAQRDTTLVFEGERYVGEYPVGQGVLYSEREGMILGRFDHCIPQGRCIHFRTDGDIYEGEMQDGAYFGKGRYYSRSGKVISGDFFRNTATGQDTLWYAGGTIYWGSTLGGKPSGDGFQLWKETRNPPRQRGRQIDPGERMVYLFCDGRFSDGKFHTGARTYMSYADKSAIGTFIIDQGIWKVVSWKRLASDVNEYYTQEQLSLWYEETLRRKPVRPSPVLTEEQLEFLRTYCRYGDGTGMR